MWFFPDMAFPSSFFIINSLIANSLTTLQDYIVYNPGFRVGGKSIQLGFIRRTTHKHNFIYLVHLVRVNMSCM